MPSPTVSARSGVSTTVANQAPTAASVVETNTLRVRQTGLFYQTVRISNPTPWTYAAVRLSVSNLPLVVRVWNATGTSNGVPFVLYNQPLPPGQSVDLSIEYYIPDRRTMPNPVFTVELIPFAEFLAVNQVSRHILAFNHEFQIYSLTLELVIKNSDREH